MILMLANDSIFPLIFFGFIILIVAVVVVVAYFNEKKRAQAWEDTAGRLGFSYFKKEDSILGRLGAMKIFSKGHSQHAKNVLKGDAGGIEVMLCDYQYTTGSGKNRTTHHSTLCMLSSQSLSLPHCFLRRQYKFFDFLGKLFGGQDIDFDEDPKFSELWVLQGENESDVRGVFNQQVREYFSDLGESKSNASFQFEAQGETLVVYKGKRIKPAEAEQLMSQAFDVLNIFG
ncbi:MAG: hypothetical protein JXR97_12490 [Planctomycetes bacterium]|nr:hypothetical protein [Planctomycetota bacterium]